MRYRYFDLYGSLAFKKSLSIYGGEFRLSSAFAFLDSGLPTISILYRWSGICAHHGLCSCLFSPVTPSELIIIFNFSFLHTPKITFRTHNVELMILRTHTCYSIKRLYSFMWISFILFFFIFYSFILLVNALCTLLLSLCYDLILEFLCEYTVCLTSEPLLWSYSPYASFKLGILFLVWSPTFLCFLLPCQHDHHPWDSYRS